MTVKRRDEHGTEFGDWIREPPQLSSKKGFVATNVDYMWRNYNTNEWMLIEEKRKLAPLNGWQLYSFNILRRAAQSDKKYRGFVLLQFQNTTPDDGDVYWNNEKITADELIQRLEHMTHGAFLK